jgi:TPR repeat protein
LVKFKNMKGNKKYLIAMDFKNKLYSHDFYLNKKQDEEIKIYNLFLLNLKKAAHLGHTEAMYEYAILFEDIGYFGINNPFYSSKKCIFWYTKCIKKNHPEAHNNLSNFYLKGEGCAKNIIFAIDLL